MLPFQWHLRIEGVHVLVDVGYDALLKTCSFTFGVKGYSDHRFQAHVLGL